MPFITRALLSMGHMNGHGKEGRKEGREEGAMQWRIEKCGVPFVDFSARAHVKHVHVQGPLFRSVYIHYSAACNPMDYSQVKEGSIPEAIWHDAGRAHTKPPTNSFLPLSSPARRRPPLIVGCQMPTLDSTRGGSRLVEIEEGEGRIPETVGLLGVPWIMNPEFGKFAQNSSSNIDIPSSPK